MLTVDMDIVGRKMEWAGVTFDPVRVLERTRSLRGGWDMELQSLMEHVPPFDVAISTLEELLEGVGATDPVP